MEKCSPNSNPWTEAASSNSENRPKGHWKFSGVAVTSMFVRIQRHLGTELQNDLRRCAHTEMCTRRRSHHSAGQAGDAHVRPGLPPSSAATAWKAKLAHLCLHSGFPGPSHASSVSVLALTPVREVLVLADLSP